MLKLDYLKLHFKVQDLIWSNREVARVVTERVTEDSVEGKQAKVDVAWDQHLQQQRIDVRVQEEDKLFAMSLGIAQVKKT